MTRTTNHAVLTIAPLALLGVLVAPIAAQTPEDAASPPIPAVAEAADAAPAVVQAKTLTGKDVKDEASASLGTITDLAFAEDGSVVAMLRREDGSILGIPLDELEPTYGDEPSDGVLPIREFRAVPARERIDGAPTVNDAARADGAWLRQVREHFAGGAMPGGADAYPGIDPGSDGQERDAPAPAGSDDEPDDGAVQAGAPAMPAGGQAGATGTKPAPRLDSVVGYDVENEEGEELGTLSGVAVNLREASVAYAIIAVSHGMFGVSERHHGVAWNALQLDATKQKVTLPLDPEKLKDMPGIDLKALPSLPDLSVPARRPVSLRER